MKSNKIRLVGKWLLRALLAGLLVFFIALGTLPFWLGAAVRAFSPEGVSFSEYDRNGYTSFALHGISVDMEGAAAKIDVVEALYPWTWVTRVLGGKNERPYLSLNNARIVLEPTGGEEESEPAGLIVYADLFDQVENAIGLADKWVGYVTADRVEIQVGEQTGYIENVIWKDRVLKLDMDSDAYPDVRSSIEVDVSKLPLSISVENKARRLLAEFLVSEADAKALLKAKIAYLDNALIFEAETAPEGLVVEKANWEANSWSLNKEDLGIEKSAYNELQFDLSGSWQDGEYRNEFTGQALATGSTEQWPSIDFEGRASGDLEAVGLEALSFSGPGVNLQLNKQFNYAFESGRVEGDVAFDLNLDLTALNVDGLAGIVNGNARFKSSNDGKPSGVFDLTTNGLQWQQYALERTELAGNLEWPILSLNESSLYWNPEVKASFSGNYDLSNNTVSDGLIDAHLKSTVLAEFLPEGIAFDLVTARIKFFGRIDRLLHKGEVVFDQLSTEQLKPIDGEFLWYGESKDFFALRVGARGDDRMLEFDAGGSMVGTAFDFELNDLKIKTDRGGELSLKEAVRFSLESKAQGKEDVLDFELSELTLESAAGASIVTQVDSLFPNFMDANFQVKNLEVADWASPWLVDETSVPELIVNTADIDLKWDNGPAVLDAGFDAMMNVEERAYRLTGDVVSSARKTEIEAFRLSVEDEEILTLSGEAPPVFDPRRLEPMKLDPSAKFKLNVSTNESPLVVEMLDSALPVDVENFDAEISLEGELGKPTGSVVVQIQIPADEGENGLPEAAIDLEANVVGEKLELLRFSLNSGEDTFNIAGQFELPEDAIGKMIEGESIDWSRSRIDFTLPQSDLMPISRFAPQYLGSEGTIQADLKGESLDSLVGSVELEGVNTRSIFPFGALREITTKLAIENEVLNLEGFVGHIGRDTIGMEGFFNMKDNSFDLSVAAENAPLLRQAGMLIRSDLDLRISQSSGELAEVTGEVNLRESLFMMDTSVLASGGGGGGRSAESRPPYFSVDVSPLNDWKLNLGIKGDRFLKLRTPVANGLLSVDLDMVGTLEEPLLKGRVLFDEGDLVFPFAAFKIQRGDIDFRIEDPYTPIIEMAGETRRYGYDLSVGITGAAFDPQVQFTSSPPLSSEQILLMVMAGENPEGLGEYSSSKRASKIGSYLSKGLFSSGDDSGGIGSRLSIESGQNLSRQGKETMEIIFNLQERFDLVGEYDEYDAWNAGLRWGILKQGTASEQQKEEEE